MKKKIYQRQAIYQSSIIIIIANITHDYHFIFYY